MVNVDVIISSLIAQVPLIAVAVIVVHYSLDKEVEEVKANSIKKVESVKRELGGRIDSLEGHIDGLEARVGGLPGGFWGLERPSTATETPWSTSSRLREL
ncbi:MAG: hypothetical protein ACP5I3_07065 [Thermoproteus sp.]